MTTTARSHADAPRVAAPNPHDFLGIDALLSDDERLIRDTVRAFVRADRSWQHAAAYVHVHKQTLGYRLRKVEELTGRGFARTQHLAEWWFALQALDLLATCRGQ